MGDKLRAAYGQATTILKKEVPGEPGGEGGSQRGGTCGLYSLWYASIMIRTFRPEAPVIWPRRRNMPKSAPSEQQSLRHFAKHSVVGSGQGEIMNLTEMIIVIKYFGYNCDFSFSTSERGTFITNALAAEQPVLLPYLEGGPPPSCYPVDNLLDKDSGAHWGLIYDETSTDYVFIDPHKPNTPQKYPKHLVLSANALVDAPEFRFQTSYNKEGFDGWGYKGPKTYSLGDIDKRSRLETLLISVS